MTKEQFYEWAKSNGWEQDRFGHCHKGDYRFKVQKTSVRLEKGYRTEGSQYSPSEKRWIKVRGAYLKDLSVSPDGKLVGMK